jgi:hypothetical protein
MVQLREDSAVTASRPFFGRERELQVLGETLALAGPRLAFVHGIAGIGKSTLVHAFAARARAGGATVVTLDCRTLEPTERGFLRGLASALGSRASSLGAVVDRLAHLVSPVVLVLDTYEVFRFLDTWMREQFLPALGSNVRVVLAGREPPVTAWLASPEWDSHLQTIALDALSEPHALAFLAGSGIESRAAQRINRFAHGHPLALRLAAATLAERPDASLDRQAIPAVVEALARTYLDEVEDRLTRDALFAAAVVRRVTGSLIGAMLPDAAPDDVLDRLRAVPFVLTSSDGLLLHDSVREALAGQLRAADPHTYRELRRRAWQQLRHEVKSVGLEELWRYTADVLYILENPVIRDAFFPTGGPDFAVEPVRDEGDYEAIRALVCQHEPPAARPLVDIWLKQRPESFFVARNREGVVKAFYAMFSPAPDDASAQAKDPITSGWQAHIDREPMPAQQRAVYVRYLISESGGEMPSAEQAACWLDIKRTYMQMRPELRRIYMALREPAQSAFKPVTDKLGFRGCGEVDLGEVYHLNVNDFGPESVDGWLARLVAAELGIEQGVLLDRRSRELIAQGERVPLTRLEFGVMQYLFDHEGDAVTRQALLEHVWEDLYQGGSNVVDAVVRTLRRKLGDHAGVIRTISGVGYQLRL